MKVYSRVLRQFVVQLRTTHSGTLKLVDFFHLSMFLFCKVLDIGVYKGPRGLWALCLFCKQPYTFAYTTYHLGGLGHLIATHSTRSWEKILAENETTGIVLAQAEGVG